MWYRVRAGSVAVAPAALLLLSVAWTSSAEAQQRFSVESQGGIAIPASRLADVTKPGPNVGLQVAYNLTPMFSVGLAGDVNILGGERLTGGVKAPDMRLWQYGLAAEARLLPARVEKWIVRAGVGVGATTFASDKFAGSGSSTASREFDHTYFTTNAGMRVGYAVSDRLTTFVSGKAYWIDTDKSDTQELAALDPARVRAFDSAWSFPITAGLNLKI